jgi:hypothetical protein
MWTRESFEQRIAVTRVKGKCWGRRGHDVVNEIETSLGVALNVELRGFAENVGNAIVGPFSVVVTGSEDGKFSCITETRTIRCLEYQCSKLVKIMEHAGESYFAVSDSDSILCYDSLNMKQGMETQLFHSFAAFVDWLFEEAKLARSED